MVSSPSFVLVIPGGSAIGLNPESGDCGARFRVRASRAPE
jgi:hypothetical protein